ncbi:uncharacterized protein BX663DRAFT_517869 [Cokeromyces recurvatus]|uniref:uncharacterized protein n=1 Tax=Cokeromyces recurvatus TaxID=90255 RepID=UPI00221F5845|nr:uncharacterized protein BX663DRAFT_517869 [Cokeromyces recurvatus]KAI7900506.1 hypothetical protein BX663DRAFT_517869 [Cokeromyces recurvatus]
MESIDHASLSSIPNSAPPSFSSISPDLSTLRQPHQAYLYTGQPSFSSNISSDTSSIHNNREPLPAYLSLYASPPKYEQAIVTQIRDLREESDSSSVNDLYHQDAAPIPSMWVPVYFAHTSNFGRRINNPNLLNFAPNHTMPSYWIQSVTQPLNHQTSLGDVSNPFDDNYQSIEHQQESES